jgi:hypothetical protein
VIFGVIGGAVGVLKHLGGIAFSSGSFNDKFFICSVGYKLGSTDDNGKFPETLIDGSIGSKNMEFKYFFKIFI